VGLVLALGAGWLARRFAGLSSRRQLLMVVAAAVAGAALLGALLAGGLLPKALAARIMGFSLGERSVWERLWWSKDALGLVKDSPILGSGGGGWAARYWQYQTYNYYTREIHNDYIQTLVETGGLVGFLALLALLGTLGRAAWRAATSEKAPGPWRHLVAPAAAGALMLALHGLLDADFTLLVPGVVFWLLLGAVDGLTLGKRVSASAGASRARAGLIVAAVALSSVAVSLFTAQQVMREAVILSTKGAWPQSVAGMARASIFDPWSTDIRVQRALILEAAGIYNAAETPGAVARAREQYVTALELQPDGPNNHDTYGLFAMRNGMTDVGIAEFEKALELQPFEALRYARAAEAHFALGYSELTNGHSAEAHPNLGRCVELKALLAKQAAKVPSIVPQDSALPAETPTLNLQAGKALALLGRFREAQTLLVEAHEARLCELARETNQSVAGRKFETALWLLLVEERLGHAKSAANYLKEVRSLSPEPDELRQELGRWIGATGT